MARGKSGIRHHQKLDLERHPEKAQATHRKLRAKDRPLVNDFISDEAFEALLLAWFSNAARVLRPGGSFYVWGGYANLGNYPLALKAAGLYFSQAIIWDKEHPVLTRKDFMGAHEWSLYGWKEGAAHRFFGPPNVTDLWHVKKVSPNAMVHLTEKPVELARRAIEYSSLPGEAVLDPFAGSGSTLVAAEQTGRRAYLMEIDPLYADVVVARFEAVQREEGRAGPGAERRRWRDGRRSPEPRALRPGLPRRLARHPRQPAPPTQRRRQRSAEYALGYDHGRTDGATWGQYPEWRDFASAPRIVDAPEPLVWTRRDGAIHAATRPLSSPGAAQGPEWYPDPPGGQRRPQARRWPEMGRRGPPRAPDAAKLRRGGARATTRQETAPPARRGARDEWSHPRSAAGPARSSFPSTP